MTLDDDRMPWPAQEAIERGENPEKPSAQFRLATLLSEHDNLLTIHHHMQVAGRVLAFLPRIVAWSEQDKPAAKATQLRRQPVARADNETWYLEEAHYHLNAYRDAMSALSKMGSVYAKDYDPDAVAVDREDDRAREARQDEAANRAAPRGAA